VQANALTVLVHLAVDHLSFASQAQSALDRASQSPHASGACSREKAYRPVTVTFLGAN